ncbi:choice-of-anchor A domain-containing protein [Duganella sp. 1411]|uniref:choice-of-anchor A family protein n=1 Tax=Duganella sp. 1411 TaxID=2806572 RepID=UPI001AE6B418|nr:choice-of-anchor A family protein [Duganella sp. 1411]MBP1206961.1 choice-of-anchor A domain-containing protein [Duganella sp. 1411]
MSRYFALSALATAAAILAAPAQAGSLNQQQIFDQFNVVTLGDMKSTSHVDGRTYVTGSIQGNGAVLGMHPNDIKASNYAAVTVKGVNVKSGQAAMSGTQVTDKGAVVYGNIFNSIVNNGSSAIYGNSVNTSYNGNGSVYIQGNTNGGNVNVSKLNTVPAGSVQATNSTAATSTDMGKILTAVSNQMKTYQSTGSKVVIEAGKATFNAKVNNLGVAVFDLTDIESTLFNQNLVHEFAFNFNGATSVYMNSGITSGVINDNFLAGSAIDAGKKVIWNFYNATDLTINAQFGGSILAVNSNLINNANIEGGVYVNNLDSRAEIHINNFAGAVPEAETYAMMVAGLGLLGFMVRRRKGAQA